LAAAPYEFKLVIRISIFPFFRFPFFVNYLKTGRERKLIKNPRRKTLTSKRLIPTKRASRFASPTNSFSDIPSLFVHFFVRFFRFFVDYLKTGRERKLIKNPSRKTLMSKRLIPTKRASRFAEFVFGHTFLICSFFSVFPFFFFCRLP
jgi:hypothetical protein